VARSRQDLVTKPKEENMRSRITNNKRMPEISQQAVVVSPTPLTVLRLESLNRRWLGDSRFVYLPSNQNEVRHEIVQL
jgi:hypothetical protein